jgi:hypothetical protein
MHPYAALIVIHGMDGTPGSRATGTTPMALDKGEWSWCARVAQYDEPLYALLMRRLCGGPSASWMEAVDLEGREALCREVTVVTLCRNNHLQLQATLAALPAAVDGLNWSWQVLVVDGSDDDACAVVALDQARALDLPLCYVQRPARGIYTAMNEALSLADGGLVAFMHAGDRYLPAGLTALVQHWQSLVKPDRPLPAAAFGQAWVQPSGRARGWVTPDPAMRRLKTWLRLMVPCHQGFVFERGFALIHPYATGSLVADRAVMRAALAATGSSAYLRQQVCVYALDGVSSRLPDGPELWKRLWEPQRTGPERAAELAKACLRPLMSQGYPRLMRWRARLWGLCCR